MAEFKLEQQTGGGDYSNRASVEIRFKQLPTEEDYTALTTAVATIDQIARKYVLEPTVTEESDSE